MSLVTAALADQETQAREGLFRLYNDERLPFKDDVVRTLEDLAPGAIIPADVLERYAPLTPEHIQEFMEKQPQGLSAKRLYCNAKLYGYLKLISSDQKTDVVDAALRQKARNMGKELDMKDLIRVCEFIESDLDDDSAEHLLHDVERGLAVNLHYKKKSKNRDILLQLRDGDFTSSNVSGDSKDFGIGNLIEKITGGFVSKAQKVAEESERQADLANPGRKLTPRECEALGENSALLSNGIEALREVNEALAKNFADRIRKNLLKKPMGREITEKRVRYVLSQLVFALQKERDPATGAKSSKCLQQAKAINRALFDDVYQREKQSIDKASERWAEITEFEKSCLAVDSDGQTPSGGSDGQTPSPEDLEYIRQLDSLQQKVDQTARIVTDAEDFDDSKGAELAKRVAKVSSAWAAMALQDSFADEDKHGLESLYKTDYLSQYIKHKQKMLERSKSKPQMFVSEDAYDTERSNEFTRISGSLADIKKKIRDTLNEGEDKLGKANFARLQDVAEEVDTTLGEITTRWSNPVSWFRSHGSRAQQAKRITELRAKEKSYKGTLDAVRKKLETSTNTNKPADPQPQAGQPAQQGQQPQAMDLLNNLMRQQGQNNQSGNQPAQPQHQPAGPAVI